MSDISRLSRLLAGINRGVNLANSTLLVENLKIKAGSGSNTEFITFSASALTAGRTITMPNEDVDLGDISANAEAIGSLQDLTGVAGGEQDLGTFTGTTIPDDSTIKEALQSLETAVEAAVTDTDFSDDSFRISDDSDATKKIAFEASEITAATVRTITMPDSNVDLGDIADNAEAIADLQTLSGVAANAEDLGEFTGSIIPDDSTIKEALQSLETEIESLPTPFFYAGNYNASTNSPDLVGDSAFRIPGAVYRVSTAGTQDFGSFGGSITVAAGDKLVYNGINNEWEKWDVNDNELATSDTDDLAEGATNLYFTDERAQDAVGSILVDSDTIDLSYDDAENEISASVKTQMSITSDSSGIKLDGDADTPGNSKYYGTNASGTKGYHDLPEQADPEVLIRIADLGEDIESSGVKALRWAKGAETAGSLMLADIDASVNNNFYVAGLMVAAGDEVEEDEVIIVKMGKLVATGHGLSVGLPVFLDENGAVTQTAPSEADEAVVRLGIVQDANTIDVHIEVVGIN
jgi:hypothetical protein